MKVILLEIDRTKKRFLLSKLAKTGLLALKTLEGGCDRERVEIYAEQNSISKIIKTIVKLARDGFFVKSPVEVLSIRSAL